MRTDSKDMLRVAIVGCGRIGSHTSERVRQTVPAGWLPLSHAEAIQANKGLKLIALCDMNPDNLSWAGRTYGVQNQYRDYKDLIIETRPDILSIATRTAGRCDIIQFAAEHGVKGVHAEKPFSRNMAECNRALDAIAKNGVELTYGTTRRFMDIYRKAKDIAKSGEIGDLVEISIEYGRTMLLWNHPHSVDLLLFFSDCDEVEYVQASCVISQSLVVGNTVDEDPTVENAFVKFKNGINGVITSSSGLNVRLSGTRGTLIVVGNGSWLELRRQNRAGSRYHLIAERIEIIPEMSGTQRAFCELRKAILGRNGLTNRLEEIATSQSILFSCVLSSLKGGIRVDLAGLPDDFTVTGRFGALYA